MDFTSLYSTRIQNSFDEDLSFILGRFRGMPDGAKGLKLITGNYYKGLPIVYPAHVLGIDRDNLDIDVNPHMAAAIAAERYVFLRSPLFQHQMVAHVQYVNVRKHMISVNRLSFVEVLAEQRGAVRLDTDPSPAAAIRTGDQKISGVLRDVSVQGVAILVNKYAGIDNDAEVRISFMLPDPVLRKQSMISAPGSIVAVKGDISPYLYKFRITPEKHQEQLISRYSFQRQVEIVRELKETAEVSH